MGRACDCCGPNCDSFAHPMFIDRYKPKFYSITETLYDDHIQYFTIDENENQVLMIVNEKDSSKETEIGSLKRVENYNYSTSPEDVVIGIGPELLEQYPAIEEYTDLTHENKLLKRKISNVSIQTRTIVEFDCSDILDTSEDLVLYSHLSLGDSTDRRRRSNYPRDGGEKIPEGASLGVTFDQSDLNSGEDVVTFSSIKVAGYVDFSQEFKPTNFQEWDEMASGLEFSVSANNMRRGSVEFSDNKNTLLSINLTDLPVFNGTNIGFLISPYDSSFLESQNVDGKDTIYGYYTELDDFRENPTLFPRFEVFRPPFGDDFSSDNATRFLNDKIFHPYKAYGGGDWHDVWRRVDDMWTFVSDYDLLNHELDIVEAAMSVDGDLLNYGVINHYDFEKDLQFSFKVYKESKDNKKSGIEKVYFDGLFYYENRDTMKYISTPRLVEPLTQYGQEYSCKGAWSYQLIDPKGSQICGLRTYIDPVDSFMVQPDFVKGTKDNCTPIIGDSFGPEGFWYNGDSFGLNVFEKEVEAGGDSYWTQDDRLLLSFTNMVDGSDHTCINGFDLLSITDKYVQSLSTINWENYSDFFNSPIDPPSNFLWPEFRDDNVFYGPLGLDLLDKKPFEWFTRRLVYDLDGHSILRKYDKAKVPEIIEAKDKTYFFNEIESPKVKISFKNNKRKFPFFIDGAGIGDKCYRTCLHTESPVEWEITKQSFSLPLLPTVVKWRDSSVYVENSRMWDHTRSTSTIPENTILQKCYTTFASPSSRFEIHGEYEQRVASEIYLYRPKDPVYYNFNGASLGEVYTGPTENCDPNQQNPDIDITTGIWQYLTPNKANWRHPCAYKFDYKPASQYYAASFPPSIYKTWRSEFRANRDRTYLKRSNPDPIKLIKETGFSKKVLVDPVRFIWINDIKTFESSDEKTKPFPVNEFLSGSIKDFVIGVFGPNLNRNAGNGIRFRLTNRPATTIDDNGRQDSREVFSQITKLGEHFFPIYQQELGVYRARRKFFEDDPNDNLPFSAEEVSEIYSMTMGEFDYWYQIEGDIFIEDNNGKEERLGKSGYYVQDPYFKINTSGKQEGPFSSSGFQSPPAEALVDVETVLELPAYERVDSTRAGALLNYTSVIDLVDKYQAFGPPETMNYDPTKKIPRWVEEDLDFDVENPDPIFNNYYPFDENGSYNTWIGTNFLVYWASTASGKGAITEGDGFGAQETVNALGEFPERPIKEWSCIENDNYCDQGYFGWTELPKLASKPYQVQVPESPFPNCGAPANIFTQCTSASSDPTLYSYTNYSIIQDAFGNTKTELVDQKFNQKTCSGASVTITAFGYEVSGEKLTDYIYNLEEKYISDFTIDIAASHTPLMIRKPIRHVKIVLASELFDPDLELSFDENDGVFIKEELSSHRNNNWYLFPKIDEAKITSSKSFTGSFLGDSFNVHYFGIYGGYFDFYKNKYVTYEDRPPIISNDMDGNEIETPPAPYNRGGPTEPPENCPQGFPPSPGYFCNEEKHQHFDCGGCEHLAFRYSIGADNESYGQPGDPFYERAKERSKKHRLGLHRETCTDDAIWRYSFLTSGDGISADSRSRLPIDNNNFSGYFVGDIVITVGDYYIQDRGSFAEDPTNKLEIEFTPIEPCRHGVFQYRAYNPTEARLNLEVRDIFKDYTFTLGVSQ